MENQVSNEVSKKKYLLVVVLMALALVGASAYLMMRSSRTTDDQSATPTVQAQATTLATPAPSGLPNVTTSPIPTTVSTVKIFTVIGSNFSFSPQEIKVKKGDTVKIVFQNSGGMHDWVIDEFNAKTPAISGDQQAEVQFVADKIGTFQYYCSVGSHRAMGMWGTLIVQ